MTVIETTRRRVRLAAVLLGLGLALPLGLTATPAFAQNEPPVEGAPSAEGEGSGRTLDGYFVGGCLAGLFLFLVGKTARRL
jgi:hypothetical protein